MTHVLVTGSAGFLGGAIADALEASGLTVVRWTRRDADLALADTETLTSLLQHADVSRVVHCAGLVGPIAALNDPRGAVAANVTATLTLAQASAAADTALTLLSTADVYGAADDICLESRTDLDPPNLYALTKLQAEQTARLVAPAGLQILRVSAPYGPDHTPGTGRSALTTICWQAVTGQRIPIFRGGRRSWCWVDDLAAAATLAITQGEQASDRPTACAGFGTFNLGREDDLRPMEDVARLACRIAGAPEELVDVVDPPSFMPPPRHMSTAKLDGLGWAAQTRLEDGVERLVEWVRQFPA